MKKFLIFCCVSVLLFSLVGCGGASVSSAPSSAATSSAPPSVSAPVSSVPESTAASLVEQIPHAEPAEAATGQIADFAAALSAAGIEYSEGESFFTMVGATDGRKFYIGGGAAEIYVFETSNEAYKTAEETGELPVDFEGADPLTGVVAHKGLVLYCDGLENEAEIIDIFKSL